MRCRRAPGSPGAASPDPGRWAPTATPGKANWTAEYRFRRKDGSYAFVIDRGYVVYDQDEMPVRMIGSVMDVTERKSLEDVARPLAFME